MFPLAMLPNPVISRPNNPDNSPPIPIASKKGAVFWCLISTKLIDRLMATPRPANAPSSDQMLICTWPFSGVNTATDRPHKTEPIAIQVLVSVGSRRIIKAKNAANIGTVATPKSTKATGAIETPRLNNQYP